MKIRYEFVKSYNGYSEELDERFYDSEFFDFEIEPTLEDVQDFFIGYMFPESKNTTDLIKEMYKEDYLSNVDVLMKVNGQNLKEAIKTLYNDNRIKNLYDDSNFIEFMRDRYEQQAYENYQNE